MFDWLYFWNLIWSFFMLLSLVFVPVLIVMIYFATRAPGPAPPAGRSTPASLRSSRTAARANRAAPAAAGEGQAKRAA